MQSVYGLHVLLFLTGCFADDLQSYGNGGPGGRSGGFGDGSGSGGGDGGGGEDGGISGLQETIPGIPGEDYPIYADVPESEFSCDERVEGGKYADPTAECQVFHFCALADTEGGLITYSFLCPNGTVFNQQYFICDWWFNVDCAEAESLYGLNDDIAAENAAAAGDSDAAGGYSGSGGNNGGGRGQPKYNTAGGPGGNRVAAKGYGAPRGSASDKAGYQSADNSGAAAGYDSPDGAGAESRAAGNAYGAPGGNTAGNSYGAPRSGGSEGRGRGGSKRGGGGGKRDGSNNVAGNSYGAPAGGSGSGNSYGAPDGQASYGTGSSAGNGYGAPGGDQSNYGDGGLSGYGDQGGYNPGRRN